MSIRPSAGPYAGRQSSRRRLVQKHGSESGLTEVFVGGQGVGQACVLHNHKRDAIRQAPALVGPTPIQAPAVPPTAPPPPGRCERRRCRKCSIRPVAAARQAGRARALAVSSNTSAVVVIRPAMSGVQARVRLWFWSCFTTSAIQ